MKEIVWVLVEEKKAFLKPTMLDINLFWSIFPTIPLEKSLKIVSQSTHNKLSTRAVRKKLSGEFRKKNILEVDSWELYTIFGTFRPSSFDARSKVQNSIE